MLILILVLYIQAGENVNAETADSPKSISQTRQEAPEKVLTAHSLKSKLIGTLSSKRTSNIIK